MAKNPYALILFAAVLAVCSSCTEKPDPEPDPGPGTTVRLHTIWEMNRSEVQLNSHAGDELSSTLQPMYREFSLINNTFLLKDLPASATDQNFSCYPRIKRMADGKFIMFYHGGEFGTRVWCTISPDLKKWSTPQMLYTAQTVTIETPEDDVRRFVNPDAVVLPDGTILLVVSYRAAGHYRVGLGSGLSFRRSRDNGITWSKSYEVPVGPNWEPYLLLLPDGRIQCYFTDAIPQTRNSGTGLIVSEDGGLTWSEKIRVCQQYKYDYYTPDEEKAAYNGQKIYTDQMPSFRVLNDGKTLVGWLEARLEKPVPPDCADSDSYKSYCMMSLVRNHSLDWEDLTSYDVSNPGPEDRETNVMRGAAGYVSTFPSGEIVLSYNLSNLFRLKLGDATATRFRGTSWTDDIYSPFEYKGYWGSTEVFNNNYMAIAMLSSAVGAEGMQIGVMYLNQRQDALEAAIRVDGDSSEWTTDRAFYLCTKDGKDAVVRTARDDSNLYFALDCRDFGTADIVDLVLKGGNSSSLTMKLGASGLLSSVSGVTAASKAAEGPDGEDGFVCEAAVPLSVLKAGKGDSIMCYADIYTADGQRWPFTFSDVKDASTWQKIRIK
ncbi:MAG: hypothetical protein J5764_05585 [Bacteroidales bacterium]|nr:hypothetical protein [Bacteroidales bacterium]